MSSEKNHIIAQGNAEYKFENEWKKVARKTLSNIRQIIFNNFLATAYSIVLLKFINVIKPLVTVENGKRLHIRLQM